MVALLARARAATASMLTQSKPTSATSSKAASRIAVSRSLRGPMAAELSRRGTKPFRSLFPAEPAVSRATSVTPAGAGYHRTMDVRGVAEPGFGPVADAFAANFERAG